MVLRYSHVHVHVHVYTNLCKVHHMKAYYTHIQTYMPYGIFEHTQYITHTYMLLYIPIGGNTVASARVSQLGVSYYTLQCIHLADVRQHMLHTLEVPCAPNLIITAWTTT